jgi:glycosyltransferase involved in cell wall biosynthesis
MDKNVVSAKPIISIIVPVYNVEKFLKRCLDSIFEQQFSNSFEVIAVDDCSTDNSLEILKEYQKTESRLIIIEHNVNKKLSCARNSGIVASTGEYIMNVDSDDWLLPGALKELYHIISAYKVDIVVFNYVRENELGIQTNIEIIKNNTIVTDKKEITNLFVGACWNKIVKRELLNDLIYGKVGLNSEEDLVYSAEILLKSKMIYLSKGFYYSYFINSTSITNSISPVNFLKTKHITLSQLELIFNKYKADSYFVDYYLDYFEKWIYLEFAKLHYWYKGNFEEVLVLVNSLRKSPFVINERTLKLELAFNNKRKCLIEVYNRFGFKIALSIYLKSLLRNLKKYSS